MRAYLINLDAATDRRAFMEQAFSVTSIPVERVPAINGHELTLPHPGYDERGYHRYHGRTTKPGEIGCYLAHVKAIAAFLASGESHGLICEDDLVLGPDFERVLTASLGTARHWNVLRLTGLSSGHPVRVAPVVEGYDLCVNLGRLKGAGAYVLDRRAAQAFVDGILPMWLPWDHACDREWWFGLRACCIYPFPCSQTDKLFRSSIQSGKARKLSALRRWATTYPYQIVNELSRWLLRGWQFLRVRFAA